MGYGKKLGECVGLMGYEQELGKCVGPIGYGQALGEFVGPIGFEALKTFLCHIKLCSVWAQSVLFGF